MSKCESKTTNTDRALECAAEYVTKTHSPSKASDFQAAMNIAVMKGYVAGYQQGVTDQTEMDEVKYKKLRELAYNMYTRAQNLSTDGKPLRNAMEEFWHFINYEEKSR